jgi:transcriptional regulator with XRE-family HTH domain
MLQDILTKINKKRLEKNFSQHYMASQLNISQSYYNKIESGKKALTVKRSLEIATILQIDITELLTSNNTNNK